MLSYRRETARQLRMSI